MTSAQAVPKLASDTRRSWVILAAAVPVSIALPFLLVLLGVDAGAPGFTIAVLFLAWAFIGFLTSILTLAVFLRAGSSELERWLAATTPRDRGARLRYFLNGGGAAGWAVTGSVIAAVAVLALSFAPGATSPLVIGAGVGVVVASLFMTITAYAVMYARPQVSRGGIEFAGERPVFLDYLYLAVQVSTTFSTSDVTMTSTTARRLVTAHSLIAFGFNTVIVALLVSVLVGSAS